MQLEFRRIQQELGVTTNNDTHDQREALVMSDRVMVMEGGRMQQLASPIEAYRQPVNRFVAGFIGVTNFLPAQLLNTGAGHARVRIGELEFDGRCLDAATSAKADCALRAEQIRIAGAVDAAELQPLDSCLPAHITETIFEGDRLVYSVRCPALGDTVLRVFDHDPLHHQVYATGDVVHIGWNARDLMVFPH
jgi:putative spermidine/putrescine transport system ATP-binding protein